MRVRTLSLVAVAVAAGLSLTACQNDDAASGTSDSSSSSSASQGSGGSGASTDGTAGAAGSGSGSAAPAGSGTGAAAGAAACTTSQLAFSSSHGMGEGDLIINLKNTGSAACTMRGFPGVDLKGKDGTVSADRSKLAAPKVSVKPGEETRFTLHYPPNTSGGSGVTFTSLLITPPNETHSHSLPVAVNIAASAGSGPAITVDPVGTGK